MNLAVPRRHHRPTRSYEVVENFTSDCPGIDLTTPERFDPLVLWCHQGDDMVVELKNCLPKNLRVEPSSPEVPLERPVSRHVSLHADVVTYDVRIHDGANIGLDPPQTVPPGQVREYGWDNSRPNNSPDPLGPILLQDMADFRNHRHHGLVGALVVFPPDASSHAVVSGETTADRTSNGGTDRA